jgi:hypothetical protein
VAIEYDLEFASEFEPTVVLDIVAEKLSFKWWKHSHLIGIGLIMGAYKSSKISELSQSCFEEAYGFRSNLSVWFRLDKFDRYHEGYRNMMRATTLLLSYIPGNAVLVFNGEITVLQRINGELALNSKFNPSPPDEVTLPYEMRALASPLL